jgi:hypothetical protein
VWVRGEFNLKENEENVGRKKKKMKLLGLNILGIIFNDEMDSLGIKCQEKVKTFFAIKNKYHVKWKNN